MQNGEKSCCKEQYVYPAGYLEDIGMGVHYTQWILSLFTPWLKGSICEVGAGVGSIYKALRLLEFDRQVLLEPDSRHYETLCRSIIEDPSTSLSCSTLAEYAAGNDDTFDAFLYINVLEHIEEDEEELRLMYSLLRSGGVACIFVPAVQSLFSEYDREVGHYRRYSKKELRSKIEKAGFTLVDMRYFDFPGFFTWFVACRLCRHRPGSKSVQLYDSLVVPIARRLESLFHPVIGKNLAAIAIKNHDGITKNCASSEN